MNTTALGQEMPFVVIVLPVVVALNVIVPVPENAKFVAGFVQLPETANVDVPIARVIAPSRAPPAPPVLKSRQRAADTVTVNAPVPTFDAASKITSSTAVGAEAPDAPPEEADQFVVEVASQVPEPPTQ